LIGSPVTDFKVVDGTISPGLNFMPLSSTLSLAAGDPNAFSTHAAASDEARNITAAPAAANPFGKHLLQPATVPRSLSDIHTLLFDFVAFITNDKEPRGRSQELSLLIATKRYNWLMVGAEA
jgi:hypothetical protein